MTETVTNVNENVTRVAWIEQRRNPGQACSRQMPLPGFALLNPGYARRGSTLSVVFPALYCDGDEACGFGG
jgi:hypothetical protein